MPVTRSTEGTESASKKSTRTAKAAAVPEAAASDSATAKKAPAKTEPAASKPKKAAATAKPAPEAAPKAGTASNPTHAEITPEQKLQMIAEAAYFRAERRGFVGGNPTEDWVAAEAEVEARLSQKPSQKK